MISRKEIKASARKVLKRHYILLVFLCLVAMLSGGEGTFTNNAASTQDAEVQTDNPGGLVMPSTASEVFEDIAEQNWEEGSQKSQEIISTYLGETDTKNDVLGHTQGVFAGLANTMLSGRLFVRLAEALNSVFHSRSVASTVLVAGSFLLYFLFWFYILNLISVMINRLFLEARTYAKVPLAHGMRMTAAHKLTRSAATMFMKELFQTLWDFTIVGGIIKHYSYLMVPYIVAENPSVKPLRAVTLSRRMMDGHKMEAFKLDVSFIGWYLLDIGTLGIAGIVYVEPYRSAVFAEYYVQLRSLAKEAGIKDADLLNDVYLYEHAPQEKLEAAYSDIAADRAAAEAQQVHLTGARKFMTEWLGIWLGRVREKRAYQHVQSVLNQTQKDSEAMAGKQYPVRLSAYYNAKHKNLAGSIFYLRAYTVWSLILMFFLFSFAGWLWEVNLYLMKDGVFVNRGTMAGPWLPIYGSGGIICLVLLSRLRKNPPAAFCGSLVLCAALEYTTSWYLEAHFHQRWWDYTGYFLNLQGRICAEGILVFGIGCMLVIYLIAPINDMIFTHISEKILIPICVVLLVIFSIDGVRSAAHPNAGAGITDDNPKAYVTEIQRS